MSYDNAWTFKGKEFESEMIGKAESFIYLLTELDTGRIYVGKKSFKMTKYKQVNKVKKGYKTESEWKEYYSSSDYIKDKVAKGGAKNYKREILVLCGKKGVANYVEGLLQTDFRMLEDKEKFINGNIQLRVASSHVNKKHVLDEDKERLTKLYNHYGKTYYVFGA